MTKVLNIKKIRNNPTILCQKLHNFSNPEGCSECEYMYKIYETMVLCDFSDLQINFDLH